MYPLQYQATHDIDWFATINEHPIHLASNGGHLPFDSYTVSELIAIQHKVANMHSTFGYEIDEEYLRNYLDEGDFYSDIDEMSDEEFRMIIPERIEINRNYSRSLMAYTWSFIDMAMKGFLSFDRIKNENGVDYYHLVAWPKNFDHDMFMRDDNSIFFDLHHYDNSRYPHNYRYLDRQNLDRWPYEMMLDLRNDRMLMY